MRHGACRAGSSDDCAIVIDYQPGPKPTRSIMLGVAEPCTMHQTKDQGRCVVLRVKTGVQPAWETTAIMGRSPGHIQYVQRTAGFKHTVSLAQRIPLSAYREMV